ncbi:hypothetical protein [Bradyrhizobium sp. BR 1432]
MTVAGRSEHLFNRRIELSTYLTGFRRKTAKHPLFLLEKSILS